MRDQMVNRVLVTVLTTLLVGDGLVPGGAGVIGLMHDNPRVKVFNKFGVIVGEATMIQLLL